jgi:hypothetical protein
VSEISQELVERVERASGPDRELDCLIQVAVTPDAKCMTDPGHGTVGSTFGVMRDIDFDVWRQHRTGVLGPFYYGEPPAYTASLDAAMTLAGDHFGSLVKGRFIGGRIAYVAVVTAPTRAEGQASTPALALTAASLRARMVQS